jgi:aspartate/methionine/tyrosine aminotransferase
MEKTALVELASELDLALIVDQVFADYLLDGPAPDGAFAGPAEVLTFSLSGLSKVLALPQAKLSWMAVQGTAIQRQQALERLEVVADTFLSVGTAVQEALPELLACRHRVQAPLRARLEANLQRLRQRVGSDAEVLRCEAGWYAVLRISVDEERLALTLLEEDGVLAHPGYFFDFQAEGYLVLSLLSPDFAEGVDLLCRRLEDD